MSSTSAYRLFVLTACLVAGVSLSSAQMSKRHHTPVPSSTSSPDPSSTTSTDKPTKPTPDKPSTDQTPDDGPDFDGVQYVDKKLNTMLTVEKVNTELSPSKLLTIFVDLKNKTRKPLDLQIQTSYADVRNTPLSASDSWVDFPLKAKDGDEYCSVALSADAVKYLVKIRLEPADSNSEAGPGTTVAQLNSPTPTPSVAENNPQDAPSPTSTPRPRVHVSFSDTLP